MSKETMRYNLKNAKELAISACVGAGANRAVANSLAEATVAAECSGRTSVGFAHLPDYLEGFLSGRINCSEEPEIFFPAPTLIQVDVKGGIAQLGFDCAFKELQTRTMTYGVSVLALKNSYTAGELLCYRLLLTFQQLVSKQSFHSTSIFLKISLSSRSLFFP